MSLFLQPLLDTHDELIVDGFAGGGGASSGIEQALGRPVDVAMNHDAAAVQLHKANHPQTLHMRADIFEVCPRLATQGRPVGFAWFSPDCTFYSKARGGMPIRHENKKRRALAWAVVRWVGQAPPRVVTLENVEEFKDWGPLVAKRDPETGRVIRHDGTVAAKGEHTPVAEQCLVPDKRRKGQRFHRFVRLLRDAGYVVEWRELKACEFGAPTIRTRLFLIARRDGKPIIWPSPTHGPGLPKPYRTAAECIDWSIPMCSIFDTKEEAKAWGKAHGQASPIRPLAANTERRIARGVRRYVLDNPKPYLVTLNHGGSWQRAWDLAEPMKTLTSSRDAHAVVSPLVVRQGQTEGNGAYANEATDPLTTVTTKAEHLIVAPHLSTMRNAQKPFGAMDEPTHTVTAEGAGLGIVAPVMVKNNHGDKPYSSPVDPLSTVVAGGTHHFIAAAGLAPRYGEREGQEPRVRSIEEPAPTVVNTGNGGSLVAASVTTFYGGPGGENRGVDPDEPLRVQGTENRFGVVASFLAQNNAASNRELSRDVADPLATVAANGSGHHGLIGVALTKQRGTSTDADPAEPLDTISAGGCHHGVTAAHLQRDFGNSVGQGADEPVHTVTGGGGGKCSLVASFLAKYYNTGDGQKVDEPLHTIPTLDNFGCVTVQIGAQTYVVEDIAMRMLQPKELYAAQGFRPGYIIDRGADGRLLTKTEQVRMCGNSVCPPVAEAIVRANVPEMMVRSVPKAKPYKAVPLAA